MSEPLMIALYDSDTLVRKLGIDPDYLGDPAELRSDEDSARARQTKLWRELYNDPRGPWRTLIVPDSTMIARVRELDLICPHFAPVTARIARAANLAMTFHQPLRLDPCVVLGAPGIGKTFYARQLAAALAIPSEVIAMNLMTDRGTTFSGLTPVWRSSAPGKVAQLLIDGNCASPLIIIDELEKASPINPAKTPINVLHSLLERENAAAFCDEFLELPIRADHIVWFATANSLDGLADSIVDRLIVFDIAIEPADMMAIQRSIFAKANRPTGDAFELPGDDLLASVSGLNPRLLSRLWHLAMAFACQSGRSRLMAADVRSAERMLVVGQHRANRPIGFLQGIDAAQATPQRPCESDQRRLTRG